MAPKVIGSYKLQAPLSSPIGVIASRSPTASSARVDFGTKPSDLELAQAPLPDLTSWVLPAGTCASPLRTSRAPIGCGTAYI
jgi:hypothetical protein